MVDPEWNHGRTRFINNKNTIHIMAVNLERLKELAKPRNERAQRRFQEWMESAWLTYSQDIALALHYYMRVNEMTQRELADKMDVSPVYVGKLLKGNENLTLETICKIESVLGEKLLSVVKPYEKAQTIQLAQPYQASPDVEFSPVYSKSIKAKNRNQHSNLRLCAYC